MVEYIGPTTKTESDIPVLRELVWNERHYARTKERGSFSNFLGFIVWLENGCNQPEEYDGDWTGDYSAAEEAEKMYKIKTQIK